MNYFKNNTIFSVATTLLQIWQKSQEGTWGMTGAGTKEKITSNMGEVKLNELH